MKRVQPWNAWNTERKNITVEQFQNPDLLRTDAKVTGIAEHILYVDDDVKKINYEKAKSMIDALRLKEKEEKENAGRKSRNDNIDNQKIQKKNERMKKSQPMPEDKNQKDKNYDPFRPQLEVKSLQG